MPLQTTDRESSLALIEMVNDLPSLPDRYAHIRAVIENPRADASELASVISTDQATTLMILKFANSLLHNPMGNSIASLPLAIARLGIRETGHIAMTMTLLYGFCMPTGMVHIRAFWAHAFGVALLCKKMAALLDDDQDALFTLGLLHDIGRAILGIRIDMEYFESPLARMHGDELVQAESKAFGLDHAEAGEVILKLWRFPSLICQAVGEHHREKPLSVHAHILQLANNEALQCIPYATDIDRVQEILIEIPERPRQLLEEAGLIDPQQAVAD